MLCTHCNCFRRMSMRAISISVDAYTMPWEVNAYTILWEVDDFAISKSNMEHASTLATKP